MSASTRKLRAAVCARAEGSCEHCGRWVGLNGEEAHLDHFFGRAKAEETLETCWLLCIADDDAKTRNAPSSSYWLGAFINHCGKYGYDTSRAEARLDFVKARAAS